MIYIYFRIMRYALASTVICPIIHFMSEATLPLQVTRWNRYIQRHGIITSRTPAEWQAYHALSPRQKERFDRQEKRWLFAKSDVTYPSIPDAEPSARPSSDANSTGEPVHSRA